MGKIEWAGESTAALAVSDYGKALAWYRDVLGLKVVFELETWGWAQLQSPVDGLLIGIGQSEEVKTGRRRDAHLHRQGHRGRARVPRGRGRPLRRRDLAGRGHGSADDVLRPRRQRADARAAAEPMNLVPYTVRLYRSGPKADTFTEEELDRIQQGHLDFVASQRPDLRERAVPRPARPDAPRLRRHAPVDRGNARRRARIPRSSPGGCGPRSSPGSSPRGCCGSTLDSPVRILIAEDETIIRLDLRALLEGAGFEVCAEAKDGIEAVELAHRQSPTSRSST